MELKIFVILTFVISALSGWLTIPKIILISKKKKLFDELSARKSHHGNVPRLGGVSFFPSFLFSVTLLLGMCYYQGLTVAASPVEAAAFKELFFVIAGGTLLFFVGLADDLSGLSYKPKFVAQILVGVLLIYGGVGIENLGGLFGLYHIPSSVGWVLTVLVTVLLVNAYNLIDGIDGLCSGLALLALGAFGGWFCWNHLYVYGMMAMGIAGVVSVFFFYNVLGRRMKIFMGDTGSLTLGFLIAFFGLKFYNLKSIRICSAYRRRRLFFWVSSSFRLSIRYACSVSGSRPAFRRSIPTKGTSITRCSVSASPISKAPC